MTKESNDDDDGDNDAKQTNKQTDHRWIDAWLKEQMCVAVIMCICMNEMNITKRKR